MASKSPQILRSLAKELKAIYKKDNLQEIPTYTYLQDQFRYFQVTEEKICRAQQEVNHVAKTYLCYLESARKLEELSSQYRGRGDRSVESSANIVGLKLPKLYSEDEPQPPNQ
ncbi:protein fmc1 homolog [Plakobranchus ocellatus]|uniref:Protein FMC1 homolog n=1 Tax=Plakobranchus ocellatus TaxID=259542 RepID=A0AAV3ZF91_9GAST|nr:protein fmc1 homolog [Plakobranchus ocellatus]